MTVSIIGAGKMGRGIGHRLVAGGHDVTTVDRDPEEAEQLIEEHARPREAQRSKRPDLVLSCAGRR
jgi:3-hydroxyisobutyrate dehydrogenase-like beta-hydroxyacid dehydrogenase